MGTSSIFGFPWPADGEPPDGPTQLEALAKKVEEQMAKMIRIYPPTLISAEQTRTENTYATLTTPDQVTGLVVPAGGLILVDYSAIVECNKSQKARAAIFVGANQLKVPMGAPVDGGTQAAVFGVEGTNTGYRLTTVPWGLLAAGGVDSYATKSDVTTGLAGGFIQSELGAACEVNGTVKNLGTRVEATMPNYGGLLVIRALPAATYTVSVRFKTSEGTLKAKERKLTCAVVGQGV